MSAENFNMEVLLTEEDIKKEVEDEVLTINGIYSNTDLKLQVTEVKVEEDEPEEKFVEIIGEHIQIKTEEGVDTMLLTEELLNKFHEQITHPSSVDLLEDYNTQYICSDSYLPLDNKIINEYVRMYRNPDENYLLTNYFDTNHIKVESDLDIDYEPIIEHSSENLNVDDELVHIKEERCDSPLTNTSQMDSTSAYTSFISESQETWQSENLTEQSRKNIDNLYIDKISEKSDPKIRSLKSKKHFEPPQLKQAGRDIFCWKCHKFSENVILCTVCPRVYHKKCSKKIPENVDAFKTWICDECDNLNSIKSSLGLIDSSILAKVLSHVVGRLRNCQQSIYFETKVDPTLYPDYEKYVVNPMYISLLEEYVNNNKYINCEAFLADVKWILHNSYIFNSASSKLTTAARGIVRAAVNDCFEIGICPECYMHANTLPIDKWFIEPCSDPHVVVWAKLQGYPYWPGKLMSIKDNKVDVRFFGDHNKSIISLESCYFYSQMQPTKSKYCPSLDLAIKESLIHISLLEEKFIKFYYMPLKTKLNNDLSSNKRLQFPALLKTPSCTAIFNDYHYGVSYKKNVDSYSAPFSDSEMDSLPPDSQGIYQSAIDEVNSLTISDSSMINNELVTEINQENFTQQLDPKIFKKTVNLETPCYSSHLKPLDYGKLNSQDLYSLEHHNPIIDNGLNIPVVNLKLIFPERMSNFTLDHNYDVSVAPRNSVSSDSYNVNSINYPKSVKPDKRVSMSTKRTYKKINFEEIATSVEPKRSKNSNYDTFSTGFVPKEPHVLKSIKPICIQNSQVKPTSKSNSHKSQKCVSSLQKNLNKSPTTACHTSNSMLGNYNEFSTPSCADYYCTSNSSDNLERHNKPFSSTPKIIMNSPRSLQVNQNTLSNNSPHSMLQSGPISFREKQCQRKNILVKEELELKNISSCEKLKSKATIIQPIKLKCDDFSASNSLKSTNNQDIEKKRAFAFSGTRSLKKSNELHSKKFSGCPNQAQIVAFIDKLKNNKSATKSSLINELLELKKNILDNIKRNIRGGGFEKKVKLAMETRKKVIVNYKNNILHAKRTVWCKVCGKEATVYCCYGTYYCSQACQDRNFQSHQKNCIQSEMKVGDKYLRLNLRNRQIVKAFCKDHAKRKSIISH